MDICPFEHGRENELAGPDGLDILHAVHSTVNFAFGERAIQFLGPQGLAANFRERTIENLVSAGDHRHQLHLIGPPSMDR